jgi:hypothetical protein
VDYYNGDRDIYRASEYSSVLSHVADILGMPDDYQASFSDYATGEDFYHFLISLEALYSGFGKYIPDKQLVLEAIIKSAISKSEGDLSIEWNKGEFWPSGAKLLDEVLVNDSLRWLSNQKYIDVLKPFEKGLRHLFEAQNKAESLKDVVTEMYEALEALAKVFLGNNKDLSGNREAFVSANKLSSYYKKLLSDYIDYSNEYRHPPEIGKKRVPLSTIEVEAFVYITGLFIRLSIRQ